MPQLVVNMEVNIQNKDCCSMKIIASKCGTQHIKTVVGHLEKPNKYTKQRYKYYLCILN